MASATRDELEILNELAHEFGGERERAPRTYSGRGMYGVRCMGITTDNPDGLVEEAAARGLRGARRDNMGLSTIVYWPRIEAPVGYDDDDDSDIDEDEQL